MSTRVKQGLLSLALILVLGVTGVVAACCGETPNYFFTVAVVGTPDCDSGHGTGTAQWTASYHLPTAHNLFVAKYGDGVIQDTDFYSVLPHVPGAQTDVMTGSAVWHWQPGSTNPRKVRVQFNLDYGAGLHYEDAALIVFDCTSHGTQNVVVHNFEAEYVP